MEAVPPDPPDPPEQRPEKLVLLSPEGKLLGPELSRIRSELVLPPERPAAALPPEPPPGHLRRQRRPLPAGPAAPGPQPPAQPRSSADLLCAGRFPAGLSRVVTGMRSPGTPRRRGSPSAAGSGGGGAGR